VTAAGAARRFLRAIARTVRRDPDPSAEVDPRAERLAAAAIAATVLCGAVGTYLAVVGGLGPLFSSTPAAGHPPGPPVVTTPPTPVTTATEAPTAATASAGPTTAPTSSPTPSPQPTATPNPTPTPSAAEES
jgi:hypothetical protein